MEKTSDKQPPRGGVVPINDQVTGLIPDDMTLRGIVKGYDFDEGVDFNKLLDQSTQFGLQATNLGLAIHEINNMINWRLSDEELEEDEADQYKDPEVRKNIRCTIFFSYTSNMVSCGMREIIRYLAKHKMIDCIVTTAGGIEEDFIKCLAPTYIGSFNFKGETLRKKGVNRIGNMVIANDNYCKFEDWIMPHLDQMLVEQKEQGTIWSPSKIIQRLGENINDETSIYHWCAKNKIPVFCPALTDGSLGDMIYSHSFKNPGLIVDIAQDIVAINTVSVWAKKTGMIILGGGIVKHHVCNANLFRSGADYSVFINTGHEYDGSDSGAHPDEAVSWGKIKMNAKPVKISTDASLVFPLIVAKTFAQNWEPKK